MTNVFNNVVINIFSNFVPDKIDDRDPLWMNDFIKTYIKQKKSIQAWILLQDLLELITKGKNVTTAILQIN